MHVYDYIIYIHPSIHLSIFHIILESCQESRVQTRVCTHRHRVRRIGHPLFGARAYGPLSLPLSVSHLLAMTARLWLCRRCSATPRYELLKGLLLRWYGQLTGLTPSGQTRLGEHFLWHYTGPAALPRDTSSGFWPPGRWGWHWGPVALAAWSPGRGRAVHPLVIDIPFPAFLQRFITGDSINRHTLFCGFAVLSLEAPGRFVFCLP